jgi:hypothetical protein
MAGNTEPERRHNRGSDGCLDPELWLGIPLIVAFVAVTAWGATRLLTGTLGAPIWLAIPVGVIVGILLFSLVVALGNHTLMEAGCMCFILPFLFAIWYPVFQSAREKARMERERRRQPATSSVGGQPL